MKKRGIQVALAAALVAVAFALRGRSALPDTPEAAVTAFFDAAARGDDRAYVALTAGDLRKSLLGARDQLGTEGFRANLRRTAAGIKGLAVTRGSDAPPGLVALDVELVFADHNERQRVLLSPQGGGWAIAALGPATAAKPPIPYGTPVFEE